MLFRVCGAAKAEITVHASYFGELVGFGLGAANLARFELWAFLHDKTTGKDVATELIVRQTETGDIGGVHTVVDSVFLDPRADLSADLEPNHIFAVGLRLITESQGNIPIVAEADFKTGARKATLTHIDLQLTSLMADADGDGLYDEWETAGVKNCDGDVILDLASLGATPDHKDIFVELDWLPFDEPENDAIDAVKAAFDRAPAGAGGVDNPDGKRGIRLWVDTGALLHGDPSVPEDDAGFGSCHDGIDNGNDGKADGEDSDCLVGDDLGGGNEIELADVPNGKNVPRLSGDGDGNGEPDFFEVKAENFDLAARRLVFHYAISGPEGDEEGDAGLFSCEDDIDNDADGATDADDKLECFGRSQGSSGNFIVLSTRGKTFMHELGHSLGLGHGGDEKRNCKPNYVSLMSYSFQDGLLTDLDGDDVPDDEELLDYSPPRFPAGRGRAPLDQLDENHLDETKALDPSDAFSFFRFKDAEGNAVTAPLDGVRDWNADGVTAADEVGVDWNGDGDVKDTDVKANIDDFDIVTEGSQKEDCENDDFEVLTGHDDWTNLAMRFRPDPATGDAPSIEEIVDPTEKEIEQLEIDFNRTDLAVTKNAAPDPTVAGQPITYTVTVKNKGPNAAAEPEIVDTPPAGATFTDPPANCESAPGGALRCPLPPLAVGATTSIQLGARLPVGISCGRRQFASLINDVVATNRGAPDKNPADNRARARSQVLCVTYEYAAKLVCGSQTNAEQLRLAAGRYATTVNIHNPNDEEVFFFKKLAVSFPPAEQKAGDVMPIGIDSLTYDLALKIDCEEIRTRLFDGTFPDGYVEGFLVVQSPRSLDVTAVYTTTAIDADGRSLGHSSIDVERIAERRRDKPEPAPDLVVRDVRVDLVCDSAVGCKLAIGYEVANVGDGPAGPFEVAITAAPGNVAVGQEAFPGLAPSESIVEIFDAAVPRDVADNTEAFCAGVDLPDDAVSELDETNNQSCLQLN